MVKENSKYPLTITGLYKNEYSDKFSLNSAPISQEYADQICAMIQQCVGGQLSVREWGGTAKNGKALPGYRLEGVTAEILEERKAFGAVKRAQREAQNAGDSSL